jgi:hypothetical protein
MIPQATRGSKAALFLPWPINNQEENMKRKWYLILYYLLVIALLATAVAPGIAAPGGAFDVIATGLNNPRGLAVSSDGTVYVAEAGKGGNGLCVPAGTGNPHCYGATGAVTRVLTNGTQEQFATGLPSIADQTLTAPQAPGDEALGPHDVLIGADGSLTLTIGFGMNPLSRTVLGPPGENMASLVQVTSSGTWTKTVDSGDYEVANNPDDNVVDSNPYGLLDVADGLVLTDAGGNALYHVTEGGAISTITTFPTRNVEFPPASGSFIPMHAVPTTVIDAPGANYYVGQLTGFPFPYHGANVFTATQGITPTVYLDGFTQIIDIAPDGNGGLYVVEISMNGFLDDNGPVPGALIHVAANGERTTMASTGLVFPTSVAVGEEYVYVTNFGAQANIGQVIRFPIQPTAVTLSGLSGASAVGLAPLALLLSLLVALPAFVHLLRRRPKQI